MTASHGYQSPSGSIYPGSLHMQAYGYLRCSSAKCIQKYEEKCSFRFKIVECSLNKTIRLLKFGIHKNIYDKSDTFIRPGISDFLQKSNIKNVRR